jgi:ADP-heptose:LPS heptosyltransferase
MALPADAVIERIGVFRALALGDLLCATPALRALKNRFPDSELTLIGLPWARALAERLSCVDRFVEFPGHPGLPEIEPDVRALPAFISRMQSERFDLLLQMQGSGSIVNPLLATFGAARLAGFADSGNFCADPALHVQWPSAGHEIDRMLCLIDHLGIERQGTHLEFPVSKVDQESLRRAVPEFDDAQAFVCVHPGAQLPSRRWMPERFAAVADRLAATGLRVVLTGTATESAVTMRVAQHMRHPALDLAGRTDLFQLGALVLQAELVVCNDTGISHVAAALRTPSVVVSSGADVSRWAPLDHELHDVVWHDTPCRPCSHRDCPFEHACATGVEAASVSASALRIQVLSRTGMEST